MTLFEGAQRLVATSLYIGGGGPLGAESPTLHISSAVASSLYTKAAILLPSNFPPSALPQVFGSPILVLGGASSPVPI